MALTGCHGDRGYIGGPAALFDELDAERFLRAIAEAPNCRMSTANFLEATFLIETRTGMEGGHELDLFIERAAIELVPVSVEQTQAARYAWRRFGKGNHPAGLNFGDCFAYALADVTREPLLYKGDNFALTDVESALDPHDK